MTICLKSNNTFKKSNRRVLILLFLAVLAALTLFFEFDGIGNDAENHPQNSGLNHDNNNDEEGESSFEDRITCLNSPFSFDEDGEDAFHQAVMIKGAKYRRIVKPSGLVLIQFALLPHCTTKNKHNEKKSDNDDVNNNVDVDDDEISLGKIKKFLKTCGWNPNMLGKFRDGNDNNEQFVDDEGFSKMNSAGNFKTNSQLLIPVSIKKFHLLVGEDENDRNSEKCFSGSSTKNRQQQQKVVNVDVLYRRQFGFHMYHSIIGPFGLFQLWLLKHEVIKKLGKLFLINPSTVNFNYRVIYDEGEDPEKEKKSGGNPLAKIFYELMLSKIPDETMLSMKATTSGIKTTDVLVYGGFAHQVAIGKLFDDTPLRVSTELRLQMRNFASILRSGATKRKLSRPALQKNKIPSSTIFKENRPFCFESSLDQFPRFRGIRKELFEQEMVFNNTNNKIFEYGQAISKDEGTSWLQIEHALTSKLFVFSEGAGVIQQLLAPPNTTIFVIFDNSHSPLRFPFLRRAAYHTKISAALGFHRMVFVTLLSPPKEVLIKRSNGIAAPSSENSDESSIGFLEQDQLKLFRKEWKNAVIGASDDNNFNFKLGLIFVGSTPAFLKSNGVMMNPNGRQPMKFYFENNDQSNKNDDGDYLKAMMKC